MSYVIAVAGKGGTGKTTVSSLIIRALVKRGKTPVLAIDADPNSNLSDSIGINIEDTIGSVLADFLRQRGEIPQGMTKQAYLDLKLHQILKEGKDIDMLVMGCPEGPGCYCSANAMLKSYFEELTSNYPYVVVDNEAGMEHFSRKTSNKIDLLLFVSNYSLKGLRTVKKLSEMVDDLRLEVSNRYVLISRTPEEMNGKFRDEVERLNIPYIGNLVDDALIEEADINGTPLVDLPDNSSAVRGIEAILEKLIP